MLVDHDEGKPAETLFQVIETAEERVAWLELEPKTGRTHQLRIHCASVGMPILGDGKYGGQEAYLKDVLNTRRIHLHARSLSLELPSGCLKRISAPLPIEMEETWKSLGFNQAKFQN